jgi:hypothetical protein
MYLRVEPACAAIGNMELGRVIVLPVAGEILWVMEELAGLIERWIAAIWSIHPAARDGLCVFWGVHRLSARLYGLGGCGADSRALVALDPRIEVSARWANELANR